MTNGDRIRQMSNEELAEWLNEIFGFDTACNVCDKDFCEFGCITGIKAYLEREVEECI